MGGAAGPGQARGLLTGHEVSVSMRRARDGGKQD